MSRYFDKHSGGEGENAKKELAQIMSGLDPGLVMSLFEDKGIESGISDLADELFKNLSDDIAANFMASLMRKESNTSLSIKGRNI